MPQSKNEIELTLGDKSKEKKFRILAPERSRSKSKKRVNPNYQNKANTRANVKVFSSKPFNAYKNLVDTSDINESIVEDTPVTTISKITPKPKKKKTYKKFEELEIVKASKKASKRWSGVKYDNDLAYGAVSSSSNFPSTKINKLKQKEEDLEELYGTNKIPERESEYHHSDEEKLQKSFRKSALKEEFEETNIVNKNYRKKKRVKEEEDEEFVVETKNLYNEFRQRDQDIPEIQYKKEPFSDLKDKMNNQRNLRDNESQENQQFYEFREKVPEKLHPRDIYSCHYCEEVYRIIIFQNLPVKVFQCYYCQNVINPVSLDFYYKKYDDELRQLQKNMVLNQSIDKNTIIKPNNKHDIKIEKETPLKVNKNEEIIDNYYVPSARSTQIEVERKLKERKPSERYDSINIKPITIKPERESPRREIRIEEDTIVEKPKLKLEKVNEEVPKIDRKPKAVRVKEENEKQEKIHNNSTIVKEKSGKNISKSIVLDDKQKPVNFDKDWVKWNAVQNAEKIEENKKKKELIEINICDNSEIQGNSLAEAFKKKKKELIKRFESKEKDIVHSNNNNETTTIEDKKNSKNITKNDIHDETNCTRSDFKGDNTTIGEILNDSELKPLNISCKNTSEKKERKKNKYEGKNVIPEENEPSKELLDRLIYGKKAELNKKEIKEVNKRMYSKLVESKEKERDEEKIRKKEEVLKNKEKLKQYADNLKNSVVKKQKI